MNKDYIYNFAFDHLTDERKQHTQGVRLLAAELALKYGEDPERLDLAAVCHDMYRRASNQTIDRFIEEGFIDSRYKGNINLAHGPMAASYMQKKLGIEDEEVLNAVKYHTTARAGMTRLEKILFIADTAEIGRKYPEADIFRDLARYDLDKACYEAIASSLERLKKKNSKVDSNTIEAYEEYKKIYEKENV